MKYILCEEQDYEDLTRFVLVCKANVVNNLQKYLRFSDDFGQVVSVSDIKPLLFDKTVNVENWLKRQVKQLVKEVNENQKEFQKAKATTQKMLDEEYKRQETAQQAMVAQLGGCVTFCAPMYFNKGVKSFQQDAKLDLMNSKKKLKLLIATIDTVSSK